MLIQKTVDLNRQHLLNPVNIQRLLLTRSNRQNFLISIFLLLYKLVRELVR